jgi:hypothetical protein
MEPRIVLAAETSGRDRKGRGYFITLLSGVGSGGVTMLRWANTGSAMPSHKFHVGENVTLIPSISRRHLSGGIYQVTKQLPHNGRDFEYHIKGAHEQHQRAARESELTKA